MKKVLLTLASAFALAAVVNAAPAYIEAKPLVEVVTTPVGSFQEGGQVELPIITWGGDIATIFANGNSVETAPASLFFQEGLDFKLVRKDVFADQVRDYVAGKTPYIRGTVGMLSQAMPVLSKDSRTNPVVIYQMTWSTGGDCLVVKGPINKIADLKGKTIALQAYGPHVDLLTKILADASLSLKDVNVKWTKDLTGTENSPAEAMVTDQSIDAVFCVIPDGLALTSNGTVGSGAEGSVKGAKILFSTKTASRVIADVYAVRKDYFETHQAQVQKFVHALLKGSEQLSETVANQATDRDKYGKMISAAAEILLDSPQAVEDARGLYGDCTFVGFKGNTDFFTNDSFPRRLSVVSREVQAGLSQMRLISGDHQFATASFDYAELQKGLAKTDNVESMTFDPEAVAKIIEAKAKSGALENAGVISFEVTFQPNQSTFDSSLYETEFNRVIDMASTYGGAVITVEGHSDPLGYLKKQQAGATPVQLRDIKQSAKNLSLTRAMAVRDSIVAYGESRNISMVRDQFATVGHGIEKPKTGVENGEPLPPKTEAEWKSNMRVQFQLVPVESEATAFSPVGG